MKGHGALLYKFLWKEDLPVDALTQAILICTFLGFLVTWMITFAVLAIRPFSIKRTLLEDLPTPSGSLPAISSEAKLSLIATQPRLPVVSAVNYEASQDMGADRVS